MNILKHHFRFDSSSATDRFPSSVQYLLLSGIFESDKAGSWSALASKAPFHARANDCCLSSWRFHGSWPLFSLTHHLAVQFPASRVGLELPFPDHAPMTQAYVTLGQLSTTQT